MHVAQNTNLVTETFFTVCETGEHIGHLTRSQFKDLRSFRSFRYLPCYSLFQTFANSKYFVFELILVEINFYRAMFLYIKIAKNTRWKFYEIRSFFPTLFNCDSIKVENYKFEFTRVNLNYKNVTN